VADGYVLGGIGTIAAIPLVLLLRRRDGPGDHVGGHGGEHAGAHAAQGLPSVCQVEGQAATVS
jgi:hypothetical protein